MKSSTLTGFFVLLAAAIAATPLAFASRTADIMPLPAKIQFAVPDASLPITEEFSTTLAGIDDHRLRSAITRLYAALTLRTGIGFTRATINTTPETDSQNATLVINVRAPAPAIPALGEDETYTLDITPAQAVLNAPTTTGALRGLQTIIQLVEQNAAGFTLPAVTINDHPRFAWRGLLVDVARRWHPVAEIKRIIDGMELVKLNILHLHLTDDQGFCIESRAHPELHTLGTDGNFFTQDQMRDIIAYAAERAIRVVPEFDMPSHTTSWGVSHPEFLSGPPGATYTLPQLWPHNPAMDPTKPALFDLLSDFLGEMAALFPDAYMHIGGDENNGKQWNASAHIQKFIADNHLKDNHGLHAWFITRVGEILARNNKIPVGWDEILHPDLPRGTVIHSWRGPKGLAEATAAGHPVILSYGYYIDLCLPASEHYLEDPLPAGNTLTPAQQKLVLGGEAAQWSEWTNSENIDSRLWPRAAAIAERLWSPQTLRDIPDMYRRLAIVSQRLEEAGMLHKKNRDAIFRRLTNGVYSPDSPEMLALREFSDACEPVKRYQRGRLQLGSRLNPLGGFVDATPPDSATARHFNETVEAYLAARKTDPAKAAELARALTHQLFLWQDAAKVVRACIVEKSPRLKDVAEFAGGVEQVIGLARGALTILNEFEPSLSEKLTPKAAEPAKAAAAKDIKTSLAAIDKAVRPNAAAIDFPAVKGIKQLVEAATAIVPP